MLLNAILFSGTALNTAMDIYEKLPYEGADNALCKSIPKYLKFQSSCREIFNSKGKVVLLHLM